MGLPPLDAGGVQTTVALAMPAVATTWLGAPGADPRLDWYPDCADAEPPPEDPPRLNEAAPAACSVPAARTTVRTR